jgi:hypothetical protein
LDDYENNKFPLSWNIGIKKYIKNEKYEIYYVYGSDENQIHQIVFEKSFYKKPRVRYPICIAGSGLADNESEDESEIHKQIKSIYKFKPDDVVVIEGQRALIEHKVMLFDQLYS